MDLRSRGLTDDKAQQLRFPTDSVAVDLRDNPMVTRIPSSLGSLNPDVTHTIRLDMLPELFHTSCARGVIENARSVVHYREGLVTKLLRYLGLVIR